MEPILLTPRLKLKLITHAERGSEELNWLHELRSNKQTTAWRYVKKNNYISEKLYRRKKPSIYPPSKTLEDTERIVSSYLPIAASPYTTTEQPDHKRYKLAYAILECLPDNSTRFIGLINLLSLSGSNLPLPPHLVIPKDQEHSTLVAELAYSFLPGAWGKGFATEALTAVLDVYRSPNAQDFWRPWEKVWMRVIVNGRNPASLKVMRKLEWKGVRETGVYVWKGEKIFIGGEWRTEDDLYIFGGWLKE